MKISLVTDEISADPETAIELGVEWGIRDFELRGFGENRVPNFSDFQKDRIRELLDMFGARLVAISPGLFKCPYPRGPRERFPLRTFDADLHRRWRTARDLVRYHLQELLPHSIAYAQEMSVKKIVVFGFQREEEPAGEIPDEVIEAMRQAAVQAGEADLELVVEVEDEFWADTGMRTARLIKAVDHPALRVNWDPGNAFVAGEMPYPEGYEAVREFVHHVHFKDVVRKPDGRYEYVLQGQIDWAGQIEALARDRYDGYISVETHMEPKVQSARGMTQRLQQLLKVAAH